ncbi:MAG: flagellar hook-length control protein FliK [Rhodoferax sp.]|nr:flagellar hook-length control protein FliK [Rhodoferax sp.]
MAKGNANSAAPSFQSLLGALGALGADTGVEVAEETGITPDLGAGPDQATTLLTGPVVAPEGVPDPAQPVAVLPLPAPANELPGARADGAIRPADGKALRQPLLRPLAATPDLGDGSKKPGLAPTALPLEAAPDTGAAGATPGAAMAVLSRSVAGRFVEAQRVQEASNALALSTAASASAVETQSAGLPPDGLGSLAKGMLWTRDPERKNHATLTAPGGVVANGAWAEPAATSAGNTPPANFTLDAGMATPEAAIAEKAHYWVMRGVQNAELRLDAFGGGQVEVSIAVQGSDAMVEFRSDQPEARRLLQEAMGQLRDLLKNEGMSLSGGFVGTSARQEPQSQGRRGERQPAIARMVPIQTTIASSRGAAQRQSGSSVDVFV